MAENRSPPRCSRRAGRACGRRAQGDRRHLLGQAGPGSRSGRGGRVPLADRGLRRHVYLGLRMDLLRKIGRQAGRPGRDPAGRGQPSRSRLPRRRSPSRRSCSRPWPRTETARTAYARPAAGATSGSTGRWIGEAEQPETRAERVAQTVKRLSVASGLITVTRVQQGVLHHLGQRRVDPVLAAGHSVGRWPKLIAWTSGWISDEACGPISGRRRSGRVRRRRGS